MKSLYSVLVICLGYLIFFTDSASCLCNENKCKVLEDWRLDILCRLQGGLSTSGSNDGTRKNGYISWAMNHSETESSRDRRTRYNAMRFFIDAEHELKISYPNRKPKDRKGMLERFEKGINDWGSKLASLKGSKETNSTWESSSTKCGITAYTKTTTCGERDPDHRPDCPIASDSSSGDSTTQDPFETGSDEVA